MAKLVGFIENKESILKQIQDCVDYVATNCLYCNECWNCLVTKKLQKEASEKKLKTSSIKCRSICWKTGKKGKTIPYLVSH